MYEGNGFMVYAGEYGSLADAQADFQEIKELHKEKFIGHYESAIFTKREGGKVKILNTDETPRAAGAVGGAIVGAFIGMVFPPSLILLAAGGAGIGALIGHVADGMSRRDLKDLGEMLDEGEAGIVFVGEATIEVGVDRLMRRATKTMKKEMKADVEEMKRELDRVA